jgi:hypothetical protein
MASAVGISGMRGHKVTDPPAKKPISIYAIHRLRCPPMPFRLLRYCRQCLMTQQALTRQQCTACGGTLAPLLDEHGAISADFLVARGSCCGSGCRNCPYDKGNSASAGRPGQATDKTCPRCAAIFACGGVACWCNDVRLGPDALKWLERHYEDCLCPACLSEFASGEILA